MSESRAEALRRLRLGLGLVFVLGGVIDFLQTSLALIYPRLPIVIPAALWSELYYAHFLFIVLGSLGYLTLSYKDSGIFYYETLADFLIGFAFFLLFWSARVFVMVGHLAPRWTAYAPGVYLAAYGFYLRSGRSVFPSRADASDKE